MLSTTDYVKYIKYVTSSKTFDHIISSNTHSMDKELSMDLIGQIHDLIEYMELLGSKLQIYEITGDKDHIELESLDIDKLMELMITKVIWFTVVVNGKEVHGDIYNERKTLQKSNE